MKKFAKKSLALLLVVVMIACALPMMNVSAWNGGGIHNNGLGGIYIDIYKHPYTDSRWGNYGAPYGTGGCTWFVGARVMELTGKGSYNTQVGETWYRTYGPNLGFTSDQTPSGGSVICWSGHVAILEKIEGSTAYISEGGAAGYYDNNGSWHSCLNNDYCNLSTCDVSAISGRNSGFIGYVHFGSTNQNYTLDINGCLDGRNGGTLEDASFGVYGTFDVYINGTLVANDVIDYCQDHPYGTNYEINDIKATTGHSYNGVKSGSLKGSLIGNSTVILYLTLNTSTLVVNPNGGIWDGYTSPQSITHNYGAIINIAKPTRNGYTFAGWKKSITNGNLLTIIGTTKYYYGTENNITDTITATWNCNHEITTIQNKANATCTAAGNTGDTVCSVCGETVSFGTPIPALNHTAPDANGNCTRCGTHIKDVQQPTNPNSPNNPTDPAQPDTQQQQSGGCPYCGQTHGGMFGWLVQLLHTILALFGLKK